MAAAFFVVWFACAFVLEKGGGFVHILLLIAISLAVVQFAQERRTAQR